MKWTCYTEGAPLLCLEALGSRTEELTLGLKDDLLGISTLLSPCITLNCIHRSYLLRWHPPHYSSDACPYHQMSILTTSHSLDKATKRKKNYKRRLLQFELGRRLITWYFTETPKVSYKTIGILGWVLGIPVL